MKTVRSHSNTASSLCIWCIRKCPTMKNISKNMENILSGVDPKLSFPEVRLPNKLCGTCYNQLNHFSKANDQENKDKLYKRLVSLKANFILEKLLSIRRNRNDKDIGCTCLLCKINEGRFRGVPVDDLFIKEALKATKKRKSGRKSSIQKVFFNVYIPYSCIN